MQYSAKCVALFLVFSQICFLSSADQRPKLQGGETVNFKEREVVKLEHIIFGLDASEFINSSRRCHKAMGVNWGVDVGAAVYATPTIMDVFGDGRKEIVVPTFSQYIEVLDGQTGDPVDGWPYIHKDFNTHASVLVHDLNSDGVNELMYSTEDGQLLFFDESGRQLYGKGFKLPSVSLSKDWHLSGSGNDRIHDEFYKEWLEKAHHVDLVFENEVKRMGKSFLIDTPKKPIDTAKWAVSYFKTLPDHVVKTLVAGASIHQLQETFRNHSTLNTTTPRERDRLKEAFEYIRTTGGKVKVTLPGKTAIVLPEHKAHVEFIHNLDEESKKKLETAETIDSLQRVFQSLAKSTVRPGKIEDMDRLKGAFEFLKKHGTEVKIEKSTFHPMRIEKLLSKATSVGSTVDHHKSEAESVKEALQHLKDHVDTVKPPNEEIELPHKSAVNHEGSGHHEIKEGSAGSRGLKSVDEAAADQRSFEDATNADGGEVEDAEYAGEQAASEGGDYEPPEEGADYRGYRHGDYAPYRNYERDDYYDGYYKYASHDQDWQGTDGLLSDEAKRTMGLVFDRMGGGEFWKMDDNTYTPDNTQTNLDECVDTQEMLCIPPHILATPVIIDFDQDGNDEAIVPVSFFFDREMAVNGKTEGSVPEDVEIENYLTAGIVIIDLTTRKVDWIKQLDVTTRVAKYRTYIFSSPTVVDLDGDGMLEIIQSTGLGFIYVFDYQGNHRKGFPVFMGEIQGQVAVDDVDGDGAMDLCAADMHSNVACFNRHGGLLWDTRTHGGAVQGVVFGDVNGDLQLDVVVATNTGSIWAMNGKDGKILPHFPVKVGGPIHAQVLLINLNDTSEAKLPSPMYVHSGLHAVVPAIDGHVYIVDGKTGCVDKVDIGEPSYSQVLADDLQGNGFIDLLISTMSGTLYLLQTTTRFHPLKVWNAPNHGDNGFTALENHMGIRILPQSRVHRDVIGDHIKVFFEIIDRRTAAYHSRDPRQRPNHRYQVKVTAGKGLVLFSKTYHHPNKYVEIVQTPREPMQTTLHLTLTNEFQQTYEDTMSISFNMTYYNTIKWLVIVPFVLLAIALALNKSPSHLDLDHE